VRLAVALRRARENRKQMRTWLDSVKAERDALHSAAAKAAAAAAAEAAGKSGRLLAPGAAVIKKE
jgi:hypothetical protein